LRGDIQKFVEDCFREIAISNEFEIETMEIAEDHIYIFLGFPPRYSISEVVKRFKGKSARGIFQRYPEVKKELWGGEFWEGSLQLYYHELFNYSLSIHAPF